MPATPQDRCRLVLVAPAGLDGESFAQLLEAALSGGDVASLILPQGGRSEAEFQAFAERCVGLAQGFGVAAIVADDTRIAGRVKADGVHVGEGEAALAAALDAHRGRMIVGAGGAATRDDALTLGEAQPDYLFFGRFGSDTRPEPHEKNLALAEWWAEMIQIPCIVLGGAAVASVEAAAETGAEFVALSSAVFGAGVDPAAAVAAANTLLDERAPRLAMA